MDPCFQIKAVLMVSPDALDLLPAEVLQLEKLTAWTVAESRGQVLLKSPITAGHTWIEISVPSMRDMDRGPMDEIARTGA
jgi:hypothetical protein